MIHFFRQLLRRILRNNPIAIARKASSLFFYMPCPHCGIYFGGDEWTLRSAKESSIPVPGKAAECLSVLGHVLPVKLYKGSGICPVCTEDGVGDRAWAAVGGRFGGNCPTTVITVNLDPPETP
jgi:hypothetical protein